MKKMLTAALLLTMTVGLPSVVDAAKNRKDNDRDLRRERERLRDTIRNYESQLKRAESTRNAAKQKLVAADKVYEQARRVVKPGGIFAVYDVLQGGGGGVLFPVPWARDPSISHLATPDEMKSLLTDAGFKIANIHDSTEESQVWFESRAKLLAQSGPPPVSSQVFLGDDYPEMVRNQVRNLTERRIRTVSYICES